MIFEFTDKRKCKYIFTIDENNLLSVRLVCFDKHGHQVHSEDITFFEEVFNWQPYHIRVDTPLISPEAREFCEKSIISFMKMKAFW